MYNIKELIINKIRNSSILLFSIVLFSCGFLLIYNSSIYITTLYKELETQIISKEISDFESYNFKSIEEVNYKPLKNKQNLSNSDVNLDLNTTSLISKKHMIDFNSLKFDFFQRNNYTIIKEKFILNILPLIIQENENISQNRKKLLNVKNFLNSQKTLSKEQQDFLNKLALEYSVTVLNKHKIDIINELLILVDEIPNSIVLAQAANESGWGTSRFAQEFNAYFGEYTFNDNLGVVPVNREIDKKHLIKFFQSVKGSVKSYFYNINTHSAYKDFRDTRKNLRESNQELDPMYLTNYLNRYAQDKNYVENIKSIIRINKFIEFDNIKLVISKS